MNYYDATFKMYFGYINMSINVFEKGSTSSANKFGTSVFVQKPYLGTKFMEKNIKGGFDLKNQFRNKNLPKPISSEEQHQKNTLIIILTIVAK